VFDAALEARRGLDAAGAEGAGEPAGAKPAVFGAQLIPLMEQFPKDLPRPVPEKVRTAHAWVLLLGAGCCQGVRVPKEMMAGGAGSLQQRAWAWGAPSCMR
jgi:hypothetical protein